MWYIDNGFKRYGGIKMKINYKLEYDIPSCKKFVGYLNDDFNSVFYYYQYKFGGNYIIMKEYNKWIDVTNDSYGKMIMMAINKMEDKR